MRFASEDAEFPSFPGVIAGNRGKQHTDDDRYDSSMGWGKLWGSLLVGVMSFSVNSVAEAMAVSPSAVSADETQLSQQSPLRLAQQFQPPNPGSLPGRREGGGTRGESWFADGTPPIALMPESNLGLTSAGQPMLYFYLPPEVAGFEAELYMFNEAGPEEGSLIINLPQESGIIGIPLPEAIPQLSVDETYRWYFAIQVDPIDRSGDLILSGFVRRIAGDPALQQRLSTLPVEDHASVYGEQGLWFDAINLLASMRSQDPSNTQWVTQWESLLQSVDLERIAAQPLLDVSSDNQVSATVPIPTPSTLFDLTF